MNKLFIGIGLAAALCASTAHAALSGQVIITQGPNSVGSGGEFNIQTFGGLASLGNFATFCLEESEVFSPGGLYNAVLNPTSAVQGGTGSSDPISIGTAWLYSQFRAGTLPGYNGGLPATAGDLQNAIWWLEGEIGTDQSANQFILALPNAAWRVANSPIDANGAYGVGVLNVYTLDGGLAQDQLTLVPEPTTMVAGALLLLPFGASTIRILRKKA